MNAPLPAGVLTTLQVRIRAIRWQAEGIHAFELADPEGRELPGFEPGAHVDVHLPGGVVRSYSLAGDPAERRHWTLGVLREAQGRGGSQAMHERLRVGETLTLGAPRNAFPLAADAAHSILLAGGIGITPLKAMAHALAAAGRSFELHYCARTRNNAAFLDELQALVPEGRLHLHFDGGDPAKGLDIAGLLAEPAPGGHIYFCGPGGFMKACAAAASHWPAGAVHSEHFKAPEREKPAGAVDGSFEVKLARSGITVQVGPEQSIVRAIELAGQRVPTSCLSGLCGACKVGVLEGEVDHQDFILSDEEKRTCMTVCVSRAKSACLVLDL
ncbi:PDR/VanB family oxidoreductase [Paucibacter sp. R3-3]|uniref:PDR/VanB family oxidoreductase n=1 Tax=Roseateles agri TaxID=3098619 RepID=A0ABU5DE60_9BURK|nr:PDR/VanB family oxidoreductase [Paucibacter sp. R3-3]MDY0743549.1 PDR/VanB family oxidoreductase [Paucibacter sp. R3-3]